MSKKMETGLAVISWIGAAILTFVIFGCSPSSQTTEQGRGNNPVGVSDTNDATPSTVASGTNSERLQKLWVERSKDSFSPDFAVGPGDLLEISVPDMEQLKDREARISASGKIELPVLGVVKVGGMTEDQVKATLEQRLSRYMRDPDVDVSVKEYQSREVAVVGMVQKPGLFTLTSRSDTILDMISRAGGMSDNASSRIIFVPAPKNGNPALAAHLLASAASETRKVQPRVRPVARRRRCVRYRLNARNSHRKRRRRGEASRHRPLTEQVNLHPASCKAPIP